MQRRTPRAASSVRAADRLSDVSICPGDAARGERKLLDASLFLTVYLQLHETSRNEPATSERCPVLPLSAGRLRLGLCPRPPVSASRSQAGARLDAGPSRRCRLGWGWPRRGRQAGRGWPEAWLRREPQVRRGGRCRSRDGRWWPGHVCHGERWGRTRPATLWRQPRRQRHN